MGNLNRFTVRRGITAQIDLLPVSIIGPILTKNETNSYH